MQMDCNCIMLHSMQYVPEEFSSGKKFLFHSIYDVCSALQSVSYNFKIKNTKMYNYSSILYIKNHYITSPYLPPPKKPL